MSSTTLVRVPPETVIRPQECDVSPSLGEEAHVRLGYKPLRDKAGALGVEHQRKCEAIAVLEELDIRPFDPKSVNRYKIKTLALSAYGWGGAFWLLDRVTCAVFVCGSLATLFAGIVSLCMFLGGGVIPTYVWATWCWAWLPTCVSFVIAFIAMNIGAPDWGIVPLKGYERPVPEFALQSAVDISKRCHFGTFHICELSRTHDPFLIWRIPTSKSGEWMDLYLEVWNEPNFKGKRLEVSEALA